MKKRGKLIIFDIQIAIEIFIVKIKLKILTIINEKKIIYFICNSFVIQQC